MKKTKRLPQMNFEVNGEFVSALSEILKVTKATKAQFIRDAVWEKIAKTKQTHPAFQSLSAEMPNQ